MSLPVLVYDDDCGFCTRAARFIHRHGRVRLVGFSDLSPTLAERLPADFSDCAHLVTEEQVYSCGAAVEQAMARTKLVPGGLVGALGVIPGYGRAREAGYRWVAEHRGTLGRLLP